jgi:phosphoribosyl-ATP pyrophosphohydrolase
VVCDEAGAALGLAWSDDESLAAAIERRVGVYHSRRRGLWVKGESSGAVQDLLRVDVDCDRDALRFTVRQAPPGFCHEGTWTCWGEDRGLRRLARRLRARAEDAPPGSYTARLLADPALLRAKLLEEAGELAEATDPGHVAEEAADLLYFTLVRLAGAGVDPAAVDAALDARARRITRRPGDAKPGALAPAGGTP